MVKVIFQDGYFAAEGHADYDDSGRDIVCAAVSVLSTTYANALIQFGGNAKTRLNAGKVKITYDECEATKMISQTIKIGFEALAEKYPQNVVLLCG